MSSTIIDAQNQQPAKKQTKRLSFRTTIALIVGFLFTFGMLLIIVNACLVIGAAGFDLALLVLGGMLIGTLLLSFAICGWLILILTHAFTNISVKMLGSTYYHGVLKPWISAIVRGLLALIAWKVWEWAKAPQHQPNGQSSGSGWTHSTTN